MSKSPLYILLFMASFNLLSAEYTTTSKGTIVELEENEVEKVCREDAKWYISSKSGSKKTISSACINYIKQNAKGNLHKLSSDSKLEAWAMFNIIILNEKSTTGKKVERVISGKSSQLNIIQSIAISPDRKHVAVINDRTSLKDKLTAIANGTEKDLPKIKEILTFKTLFNGNVAPSRIIRNEEINDSSEIIYHKFEDEILIFNEKKTAVYSVFKESDYRSQVNYFIPKIKGQIEGSEESFRKIASVDFMNNSLLLLDDSQTKVYAVDLKRQEVLWEMDKETIGLEKASAIKYSPQNKILSIIGDKGEVVEFDQSAPTEPESEDLEINKE